MQLCQRNKALGLFVSGLAVSILALSYLWKVIAGLRNDEDDRCDCAMKQRPNERRP